jgi:hypothetical protein
MTETFDIQRNDSSYGSLAVYFGFPSILFCYWVYTEYVCDFEFWPLEFICYLRFGICYLKLVVS